MEPKMTKAAERLGSILGSVTSDDKAKASRMNGKLGGRPRKDGSRPEGRVSLHAHRAAVLRRQIQTYINRSRGGLDNETRNALTTAIDRLKKVT